MVNTKASIFRIVSFTLAAGDVVQTSPATIALYHKHWKSSTISPVCFFYALNRYMTIISLVSNGIGFYGTKFTEETCRPWYMLPNITAMLAGMAVQSLVFIRTWAISARSPSVYWGLGGVLILGFPVQVFGIVYHRVPGTTGGECKGVIASATETDWNIVYYSAHMAYDVVACATGTLVLLQGSWVNGIFFMSKFLQRVLRNGLLYFFVVFFANLWVVLEFVGILDTGVGATLPLAVEFIAAQHLILSTTHRASADAPRSDAFGTRSTRSALVVGPGARVLNASGRRSGDVLHRQDIELQSADFEGLDADGRTATTDDDRDGDHKTRES